MPEISWGGTQSHSRRLCTLKLYGTSEVLQVPIEVTTKVSQIRQLLGSKLGVEPESLAFIAKATSSTKVLRDSDEIPSQESRAQSRAFKAEPKAEPMKIPFRGTQVE